MPEPLVDDAVVPGFAGVLAFRDGQVALVRERYDTWDREHWNTPSGRIEQGESPEVAAVRELREETGLVVPAEQLTLIAEVQVLGTDGAVLYKAWNYRADVPAGEFAVEDPDGSVQEVRWFGVEEAIELLEKMPNLSIAEPAVAHLRRTGQSQWTYTRGDDGLWTR